MQFFVPPLRYGRTGQGEVKALIKLGRGVPLAGDSASLNRKSPARSGWGQQNDLKFHPIRTNSEAQLKPRTISTIGISGNIR
jgi:hypothetical protein